MAPGLYNMMNMGGYGMGSFGMGNGYNFFTNCDGTMNTNAMLGFGLANVGLNLGKSIFNCYWGGGAGGSSKAKKEDPDKAEINSLTKEINTQLDNLKKGISEEAGLAFTVETKYQTAIDDATTKKKSAESDKTTLGATKVNVGGTQMKIEDLTNDDIAKLNAQDKTTYNKYKELVDDLQKDGKYDQDIKKANDAKKAREEEIEEIQTEIKRLIAKRDEIENRIQAKSDAQVLDDADGHGWQQTSLDDFNKKYANTNLANLKKGTKITIKNDDKGHPQKVTKGDLRGLIARYRGTRDPELKKLYANQFKQLWELAEPSIQNDSTLGNAYNIMHDDMVEIGTDPAAAAV